MQTLSLTAAGLVLLVSPVAAQQQWRALEAPTSQPFSVDVRSLAAKGPVVSVDVRSPIGGGLYQIVTHEIRCADLSTRLGRRVTYDADTHRPSVHGAVRPLAQGAAWIQYGPGSDGQLVASAVCSMARRRGLVVGPAQHFPRLKRLSCGTLESRRSRSFSS